MILGGNSSATRIFGVVGALVLLGLGIFLFLSGRNEVEPETTRAEVRPAAHFKAAKLGPLKIKRLASGDTVISLDSDLYFAFNSASLTPRARRQLRDEVLPRVTAQLDRPGGWVELRGYTDGVGEADYNLRLSRERAEAARHFLVVSGAPDGALSALGLGERLAVSSERNGSLRRVDVVLHKGGSK